MCTGEEARVLYTHDVVVASTCVVSAAGRKSGGGDTLADMVFEGEETVN